MKKHVDPRRFLVEFRSSALPHIFTDVLVIGTGVAGLRAAIAAGQHARVLLLSKDAINETNTNHAQGGIAVVLDKADSAEEHIGDTLRAGYGLCDPEVVRTVISEGPPLVRQLVSWGAQFDRENDEFVFAQEGGHRRPRVIHARGDATGAEVQQTLQRHVEQCDRVQVMEHAFTIDLLTLDNRCYGALVMTKERGLLLVWANETILATGGAGQLYRETTNPPVATGDGLAMAYRAGAELRDLEFVQFHPTTLYVAGAARTLITEAVRGAGALLLNRFGERFMPHHHEAAELAPRDVVSRCMLAEMRRTGDTNCYLDLTHLDPKVLRTRFPLICQLCKEFDIEVTEDLVPVCPSAHYMIGGVAVDLCGRTTVESLLSCGEVASTGLHGANRLGSNSLLEGLVFGLRAGEAAGDAAAHAPAPAAPKSIASQLPAGKYGHIDLVDVRNSLKSCMWRCVGMERHEDGLAQADERIDFWCSYVLDTQFDHTEGWTLQNELAVAKFIAFCARQRTESRGAHYRTDYPATDGAHWKRHSPVQRSIVGD